MPSIGLAKAGPMHEPRDSEAKCMDFRREDGAIMRTRWTNPDAWRIYLIYFYRFDASPTALGSQIPAVILILDGATRPDPCRSG